ncbi:MAG: TIGR03663 family protein [Dehalococcoidia bacterium]|nr:TIGR03663 family protein [Dehalococcoidia bacterium]
MTAISGETARSYRPATLDRLLSARLSVSREAAIYAVILLAAFALRFWNLGDRALHHDESIHAQWSWSLLQGQYHHSPIFHGPFYYHVEALVFLLFGANDYTARLSAAIFGLALCVLPLLLRRRLGAVGTIAAVAFIAFSPTIVYYSRFFREDIYMAFFTLLMVAGFWSYIEERRDRWLYVTAAAFTGSVLTKEGTFISAGIFLIFLDLHVAALLAKQTLAARELDSTPRRALLALAFAPYAWALAALWPFIGTLKRRMDWDDLPAPGDLLVLLGTIMLPLLTPLSRTYLLEPLGLVDKDRLNWEKHLTGNIAINDRLALAGLFAVTTSAAAFVGLQWKPRVWAIAFLSCGFVYLTLMTSFWTNMDGLVSGPWGSLDYWQTQQDVARGDQPWFYYYMLMPMYEFLPLVIAVGGLWWSTIRGDAFSRFLVFWSAGIWLMLSFASEKMPWNNTHIALPVCMLAAWTVARAWRAWHPHPDWNRAVVVLASVAAVASGAFALVAFLPGGATYNLIRLAITGGAASLIIYAVWPYGRRSAGVVLVVAVVGALAFFSVRSTIMASFVRGDDPKDLLIYTQSSGELLDIAHEIDALATATGKGYQLPIAVDSTDSFAWPWAWYLRDYKAVAYVDFTNGAPQGDYAVLLVNSSNVAKVNDQLAQQGSGRYGSPVKYPHRWWFDETYKAAMAVNDGPCTGLSGDCGPFKPATWKRIADGIKNDGWLTTWAEYWRDHDPHHANGSVDAYAYFPANFDRKAGTLSAKPVEPPKPGVDKSGRLAFGGIGPQNGQFFAPTDVEADPQGNLYVIDTQTKKLQKFDKHGNFLAAVDIRNNPSDPNEASQPWGLGIAPNGDVVVADTFGWRIKVFDSNLEPTGVTFGTPPKDTEHPGNMELFGPRDVAFDQQGDMWVTDTGNGRIQVYTLTGQYVRTVGARGSGNGQFNEPVGIDIAKDGTVFVADMYNRRVVLLHPDGTYSSSFPVDGWGGQEVTDKPYIRAIGNDRVAVSLPSKGQVRIYDRSGNQLEVIAPSEEPLNRPYGMAVTADGKLWVVEGGSGRLRLFAIS